MKEVVIKLYNIDELSDDAKADALETYRSNREFWSEDCISDFKLVLELIGYYDIKVYWSGFYSQGDGASFEARMYRDKRPLQKIKAEFPKDERLHLIVEGIQQEVGLHKDYEVYMNDKRYVHSGMMLCRQNEMPFAPAPTLLHHSRRLADWFYDRLKKEHEFQFSDNNCIEEMRENGYWYLEDGTQWREDIE